MIKYVVRSTNTGRDSSAIRAADWILTLLSGIALVFLIFAFVLRPVELNKPMVNGLNDGELVFVDRVSKYVLGFDRGDIVRADIEGYNAYRVVAMSGEQVLIQDGRTYIDGSFLDEGEYGAAWDEGVYIRLVVPKGSMLILPDDRVGICSLDGYVIADSDIYGELRLRVYPFSRLSLFD